MTAIIKPITLGADPEVIVSKEGKIWHCIGEIGGTKEEPSKIIRDGKEIGAVQEDNVLYEFNIMPHDTKAGFIKNVKDMLAVGQEVLGDKYALTTLSSHIFSQEDLSQFPESAFIFGCEPDFFAGDGSVNNKPTSPWPGLRTAGGHVHFGFDNRLVIDEANVLTLMRLCDLYLALPALELDSDSLRRELYGKAGAHRPKAYGAEYRVLSNFWIHSEANSGFVFDQSQKAYQAMVSGEGRELLARYPYDLICEIINTNDRSRAERAVKMMKVA